MARIKTLGILMAIPSKLFDQTLTDARMVVDRSYETAVQSVNTGFALVTAMSYMELVKEIVNRKIDMNKNGIKGLMIYAAVVTLMSSIVFTVTDQYAKNELKKSKLATLVRGQ